MNHHLKVRRTIAMAACAGAALATGLIGSSAALASGSLTCDNVYASGASQQNTAQNSVWIPGFPSYSGCSATSEPKSGSPGSHQTSVG